jgi:hypothetical protein
MRMAEKSECGVPDGAKKAPAPSFLASSLFMREQ